MSLRGLDTSRPFVVVTTDVPDPAILKLLVLERAEFEAVFGTQVHFAPQVLPGAAHWVVELDPLATDVRLKWDSEAQRLTSRIRSTAEYLQSVNLLHSLAHSHPTAVYDDLSANSTDAFIRIYTEIANIFPSFELRGLNWDRISERYAGIVSLSADKFAEAAQTWVAELGDAHTALHRTPGSRYHPPYRAAMTSQGAVLEKVPRSSAAARAGVHEGWTIRTDAPQYWLTTTGATKRQHAQVAARRFLAMSSQSREFVARSPGGQEVVWTEEANSSIDVEVDPASNYLKINTFVSDTPDHVDAALRSMDVREPLRVDLRGNSGGSLVAAVEVRRRFLRQSTPLGTIRFTDGQGSLAAPVAIEGTPVHKAWSGAVTFLIDSMTYSASEDLLWGLKGLDHVRIAGSPTGGGSGRPHSRRITENLTLSVSTALTYDRDGNCIEFHGIWPDS